MIIILFIVFNILALCLIWNMAVDRAIAHYYRWHDRADDLLKELHAGLGDCD